MGSEILPTQSQCLASARSASTSEFYTTAPRARSKSGSVAASAAAVTTAGMTTESGARPSVLTRACRRQLLRRSLHGDPRISSGQRVPDLSSTSPSTRREAKKGSGLPGSNASRASRTHDEGHRRRLRGRMCRGVCRLQDTKGAGRGDGHLKLPMILIRSWRN